jgi:GR25 family glycosyltransferase involved in LPS biosynthesis
MNEKLLQSYLAEINNENNDGWTKQHYQKKYNQLMELQNFVPKPILQWRDCYTAFINLDHRQDRLERMNAELERVGIKAERLRGMYPNEYTGDKAKVVKMEQRTRGAIGCHYSQVQVMKNALEQGKSAFVMEDDLVFASDVIKRLDYAEEFLNNNDWDVFWLGGTYHLNPPQWHNAGHTNSELPNCDCSLNRDVECTSDKRIVRTYGCWGTYAYIVNHKSIEKILDLFEKNIHESIGIDWLFIKLQPQLKCFAFVPGMVKQYDNQSDIGNGVTVFSNFSNLGEFWFADKMEDFDADNFNWHEAKI